MPTVTKPSRTRTVLRNIVSNWLGYVVQAAVVFFLTPFVLRELGDARYGVWALITSVTGTYGLLAFGLQGGVNQYLARYLATRDFQKMNEVASTATSVLSLVGSAMLVACFAVSALFPYLFDIPEKLTSEIRICTIIVGASVAIQMALFVFSSMFMAAQRYDASNAIGVVTRLLSAGLLLGSLKLGYGLVGISIATAASNLVDCLLRWRIAYHLVPELKVELGLISRPIFKEVFHYGAWSFLSTIAQTINSNSGAIVIGMMLPISAMAPYALATGLIRQFESLIAPVIMVFFPAFTELHSRNELQTMRTVYFTGSRLVLVLVAVAAAVSGVFAEDFYRFWVGNEYVAGKEYPSVAILYQILLAAMVSRLLPGIGSQVLFATLNVQQVTATYLTEAIGNLLLTVVLVQKFGLIGVASASVISAVCFRTFAIPYHVGKVLSIKMATFAAKVWIRPIVVALSVAALAIWLRDTYSPSNLIMLVVLGAFVVLGAIPLIVIFGMTSEDRKRFLYRGLRIATAKIGWRKAMGNNQSSGDANISNF